MKNIKLFYQNYKKEIKRTISGITALATIMSVLPFAEVKPQIDEVVTKIVTATAEEATFAYSDADAKKISLYIDNSTTNSFKAYAQKYKDDSGFAALHKEDKISIVFGSTSNVDLTGFVGIGTSATPFAGSIEIPSGNNLILRMDAPLFTCVYDTVPVYGSNPNDPARIARFYANAVTDKTTPILAREVKKNTNTAIAKATWNVSLMPYTDETTYLSEFGGFIGTMEGGAILTVKADMTKSNAEADPDVDINSSGTENIGLCCKTMGDGAELNFTLTGDRDIKSVSASGGNAGGLVGSMGAGAKLNYTQAIRTTPFIKSKCTIQTTSGKYAGGLVGENKGTVNIVMPGSTQYVIDQTLSASEGAGGLFGYYAPDGTVASFITGAFDINCQVEDAESCGGLFGKMESSYNMTLRSAAESSGQSGSSGNGNATLSENASPISAAAPEEVAAEETVATENDEIFTESHTTSETENETDATVAEVSEAEEVSTETSESETLQEAVIQEDVVADTTALAESTDATEMTETTSLENSFTETFTNTDAVLSENATVFEEETTNPNTITLTDNPIILSGEGEPNLNIVSKNTTGTDNYGGLIGTYMASSSAIKLEINKLKAKVEANTLKNYGGAIGLIDETNPAYVYFENFDLVEVKNADKSQSEPAAEVTFGGLVAKGTKAFLDVNGAKINSSKGTDTGSYRGGGLVGDLGDGVLRMAGTIDLSGTTTVNGAQIVNLRDDALVFAEDMTAAKLIRQSPDVEFDDIGSWGEVLRFISGTTTTSNSVTTKTESLSENTVLTVNETAHSIEVGTPVLEIATAADFAKTALRFQIETGGTTGNPFVTFNSTSYTHSSIANQNISLSSSIGSTGLILAGTGLTGFTRDHDGVSTTEGSETAAKCIYSGTFDGNGKKIILSIGDDSPGFNGKVYRHNLNGLFGILDNATIKDVELSGEMNIKACNKFVFAGGAAARSTGTLKASGVNVSTEFNLSDVATKDYCFNVGRLIGEVKSAGTAAANEKNISVTSSTFSGDVTATCGDTNARLGGVIGLISEKNVITIEFDDVKTTGTLKNTYSKGGQQIGGLIVSIADDANSYKKTRTLDLTTVKPDGLTINGTVSNDGKLGGLLGYDWKSIDVNVNSVTVGGTAKSTVKMVGTGNTAGLVYLATGHWDVKNLVFTSGNFEASFIKAEAATPEAVTAKSFGMIVNTGKDGSNGIYMDLRKNYVYTITSPTLGSAAVFDELVAYSAASGKIMENGQGIVSIHVSGSTDGKGGLGMSLASGSTTNYVPSNTYHAQTANGATPNPNTRYYYNLDTITSSSADATVFTSTDTGNTSAQNRLMSWAVHRYAATNIQKYFASVFENEFGANQMGAAGTNYNMQGYSWYPLDVSGTLTVNGNYTLYNERFEGSEAANASVSNTDNDYTRTSHYDTTNKSYTQHYMMQNALFRNITGTLTVGTVRLAGTVGIAEANKGSGALVCGEFIGASDTNTANFSVSTSLILDGIRVYNFDSANLTTEYAPLLINKVTKNAVLKPAKIWADGSKYTSNNVTTSAATSLIGNVGSPTAECIKVTFSDIRLDARKANAPSGLDDVTAYGTKKTIFTKASLLESFAYKPRTGSSGRYDFEYGADWSNGSHLGHVTYGSEISDSSTRNEYYGAEFWYASEEHDATGHYVNPEDSTNPSNPPYDFTTNGKFLPYVYHVYGDGYHQLEVNHKSAKFDGCGTYNHPYTLTSNADFIAIQNILKGTPTSKQEIRLDTKTTNRWCNSKTECLLYTWNGTSFKNGNTTYSLADVREYLAGAYYSIVPESGNTITLEDGFEGLGYVTSLGTTTNSSSINYYDKQSVFHGVINGNGNTIVNESGNPLILSSNGSVVYNLNIQVNSAITLGSNSGKFAIYQGCDAYGAVMGRVFGGDNIIDHVAVSFGTSGSITLSGDYAQISPVGGYIGVVENGGVIFRGMEDGDPNDTGYFRGKANVQGLATDDDGNYTKVHGAGNATINAESKKWLYVNPIIGRVLNGYAFTEANHYRPFDDGTRTYPDGSTECWVLKTEEVPKEGGEEGETIERTYVCAVDENDVTEDTPLQPVTMRNGTKNYSIADLDKSDYYDAEKAENNFDMPGIANGTTITLSNAQALYIMSMITECGLGKSTSGAYTEGSNLKPYTSNMSTHLGSYRYVGLATSPESDGSAPTASNATTDAQKDYVESLYDKYSESTNKLPYLIKQYTPNYNNGTTVYPAFSVTGTASSYRRLVLDGDDTVFYLPDGYRGLGSLMWGYTANNNAAPVEEVLYLYSFNGTSKTVSLNMSLYNYPFNTDNYTTAKFNQAFFKTGFGLINNLMSNYNLNTTNNKFTNLKLKGRVKYEIIDTSTGKHVDYNTTYVGENYLPNPCVAALVGVPLDLSGGGSIYCENISLDSMEISGMRNTGGFVGAINVTGTFYFTGCSAEDLVVFSGGPAGGLVGYMRNKDAIIDADFQKESFGIISIVSAAEKLDLGNACNAGAGGLIGERQTGVTNNAVSEANIKIKDVTIRNGSSVGSGYIGYYNDGLTANSKSNPNIPGAGGIIGDASLTSILDIDSVEIKNLNICGAFSGGMIGRLVNKTNSKATITNSSVITDTTPKCRIESPYANADAGSGGFIGSNLGPAASAIDKCTLTGYTVSGDQNVGGLIGLHNTAASITTINNKLTGHTIKANSNAGGMIGKLNNGTHNGYNILINNQSSEKYSGSGSISNYGYIVGNNNSKVIRLVGFSRQGTIDKAQMIGNKAENNTPYGSGGYVIFADYNGTTSNTSVSSVNADDNLTSFDSPHVTINPMKPIDKTATPDFLTSDGINDAAFANILSDSNNKSYTRAKTAINDANYTSLTNNLIVSALSGSNKELGKSSEIPNFPILVVESTKKTETTKLINNYLRLLTNTDYNFANNVASTTGLGTVYNLDFIKMTYDSSANSKKFVPISVNHNGTADANSCLKWTGSGANATFGMDASDVDSSATQFTLIDLQFLDPTGATSNVVYHVYAPVLVKKVVRYNFTAKTDSGTNYFTSHYTDDMKNAYIFENLGTPVTIELEYDYVRDATAWAKAINEGESSLTNYYKQLYIKSHFKSNGTYNSWPPGAKLVLVDANNHDKFYYMDDPGSKVTFDESTGEGILNLYDFVVSGADADSTDPNDHYKPVDFCELMTVTVTQSNSGTLTDLGTGGTDAVAYENAVAKKVVGSTTTYYRMINENETVSNDHKFTATVTSGSIKTERYYLSIFTKQTTSQNVYRYEIKSVDDFAKKVDGKWEIPNGKWLSNKVNTNGYSHYFTGYIYDNKLATVEGLKVSTPNGDPIMGDGGNLSLNVQLTATVSLTDVAKTNGIARNMDDAKRQNAHLYHSFLVSLSMLKTQNGSPKIGIMTTPTQSDGLASNYYYSEGTAYNENAKVLVDAPLVDDSSQNFIELQSGQDLLPSLANNGNVEGGTNNAISLHAEYDLIYGADQILDQFPKGIFMNNELVTGTKVIGYSNVASSIAGTAYSSNSDKKQDNQFYYTANSSAATLKLNADEEPYLDYWQDENNIPDSAFSNKVGKYSMLGVNPLDDEGATSMYISTYAIYDPSKLNKNPMPGYVELQLSLSSKQGGYGLEHKLSIGDYISELKVYGNGNGGLQVLLDGDDYLDALGDDDDDTTLIMRVPTSSLQKTFNDADSYSYRIPITFKVKTGSDLEADGLYYSNYMLTVEAKMYEAAQGGTFVTSSDAMDHIIYTNAKLHTSVITAP